VAVQGVTFTIGIEMMLGADIVVAADDCRFCQMEPKRGLAVFGGAHVRYVERAGWGNAMYHLLRADEFDAARALSLGFVQEVVPTGRQRERAMEIAREIVTLAPVAVQEIKRGALVYLERGERAAFDEIATMRTRTANTRDFAEGIASFREKRPPVFEGR
jgi:enoyl-CoA hydratase/carnithine racemase